MHTGYKFLNLDHQLYWPGSQVPRICETSLGFKAVITWGKDGNKPTETRFFNVTDFQQVCFIICHYTIIQDKSQHTASQQILLKICHVSNILEHTSKCCPWRNFKQMNSRNTCYHSVQKLFVTPSANRKPYT